MNAADTMRDFLPEIQNSAILIVDDNAINRLFLEKTLRHEGFTRLCMVETAEEALATMPQFNPDLVILDIMMPGMDGFQCCEIIRQKQAYRDLPILIQTTITEPHLRVKAFTKGATDFISKPIYAEELCARVRVHLENRHALKSLQQYRNRIAVELGSARQLQQAILPSAEELEALDRHYRFALASYFKPSSEIGGDFWGARRMFPHQLALWLVDFSGHGVAAALNAFRLQAYLKEHSDLAARPGEYLSHLNDKLLHLLLRGQFATMFYGIADTQSNQLFYSCACAPHPILLRQATGKAEMVNGSGTPLGIGMHLYATQVTPFAAGDTLLLYSDALTETPGTNGECITEAALMELLEQHANASASAIKEIIVAYFKQHAGNALRDDLTVVVGKRV